MTQPTYLDIETGPLPMGQLERVMPEFEPPGNLKDPDKIKAALEAKKQDWLSNAALRSTTGQVLAVTYAHGNNEPVFVPANNELFVLNEAVGVLTNAVSQGSPLYTWNGHGFDLPFICQRCAVHNMPVWRLFTTCYRGRWAWHEVFVDAMQVFTMQYGWAEGFSLKAVSAALGVGEKSGSGADFAGLLKTDPAKAKEYAVNDVVLLRSIVRRMGLEA